MGSIYRTPKSTLCFKNREKIVPTSNSYYNHRFHFIGIITVLKYTEYFSLILLCHEFLTAKWKITYCMYYIKKKCSCQLQQGTWTNEKCGMQSCSAGIFRFMKTLYLATDKNIYGSNNCVWVRHVLTKASNHYMLYYNDPTLIPARQDCLLLSGPNATNLVVSISLGFLSTVHGVE